MSSKEDIERPLFRTILVGSPRFALPKKLFGKMARLMLLPCSSVPDLERLDMVNCGFDSVSQGYQVAGVEIPRVSRVVWDILGPSWHGSEAAMWRGSVVHKCCELEDLGVLEDSSVAQEAVGYLNGWRKWKSDSGAICIVVEEPFVNEQFRFGGRPDRVMKIHGQKYVVDIKTGAAGPWVAIQLAAYCDLCGVVNRLAVCVKPDGTYSLTNYKIGDLPRDRAIFLNALNVWSWRNENKVK